MFDFPASPTEGQVFTPAGGPTYVYKAPVWTTGAGAWPDRIVSVPLDLAAGFKSSPSQFVWNDKADLTGTNLMLLDEVGRLDIVGGLFSAIGATGSGLGLFARGSQEGNDASHIGLRGNGYAPNPNGIDFYSGGTGTAAFGRAGFFNSDKNFVVTGSITAGTGGMVSSTSVRIRAIDAANNAHLFFEDAGGAERTLIYGTNSGDLIMRTGRGVGSSSIGATGNLIIWGPTGQKSTGTTWANPSDERIKDVVGDYAKGLAEIMQLQPRRFVYRGNDTYGPPGVDPVNPDAPMPMSLQQAPYPDSPHYKDAVDGIEFPGFVAQEVEAVMPSMVTQGPGWIDGEPVDDFRILDTSNLTLALVNAVKELAARVEALEAT